jgi:hypothetical protein
MDGHHQTGAADPVRADFVVKVVCWLGEDRDWGF